MKELSIEQKAKRYDEAIEIAKNCLKDGTITNTAKSYIENIFPELKESDDKRIRKELLNHLKEASYGKTLVVSTLDYKRWADWLEKQGEQKPVKWNREDEQNLNACIGYIPDEYLRRWLTDAIHAKYDKPADKVEPKFKAGDWIVDENGTVKQILSYKDGVYKHTNGYSARIFEDEWRMWTIQDAKDGDVLCCPLPKGYEAGEQIFIFKGINSRDYVENCIEYYCRVCEGEFYENLTGYMGTTSSPIYPANKEQRDTLFAKMKESGYEWDEKERKLKKLSQQEVTKISDQAKDFERSEEDEDIFNYLKGLTYSRKDTKLAQRAIDWLKSIRHQKQWKPSKEQMKALHDLNLTGNISYAGQGQALIDLYNSLKELC